MDGRRESPHLSINKLGRYLTATPALRKRLIQSQKYPPDPQYLHYPEASRAITAFLCRGQQTSVLREHQRELAARAPRDAFEAQRAALCGEALERYQVLHPQLGLEGVRATEVHEEPPPLEVSGVAIRVQPQVLLHTVDARGSARVGLLKLSFSKHHPLDARSGQYIATLLQLFAEQRLGALGEVEPRLVRVVDVFAGQVYVPPRARTRRWSDVQLACEEIAARWPLQ